MYTVEQAPRELNFGRQGESNILSYQFDFSQWAEDWPGGLASMTVILPNQTQAWPIPVEQAVVDGTVITLYVQDNLTAKEGRGTLIIRYEAGPNKKRSRVIEFMVEKGHAPAGPAPDPVEDWIADTNVKIGELDESLVSANAAEGLRETAETARETAEGLRVSAETSRNTAEGLRASAETARNSAEGLRNSAETARKEAEVLRVAADAARMGFKPMGAYNPANENKYGEWYTHEGGSYGYIWPEPSTGVPLYDTTHWQQIAAKGDAFEYADFTPEQLAELKGDAGAKIVSGEYVGTSLKFTLDDASHFTIPGAKSVPETWLEFQAAVRDGTIGNYFSVGDQFNVLKGATNLAFDIVDIGSSTRNVTANGNAPVDPNYFTRFPNAKPVTFLMHDVINGVVFDSAEANYQITTGIPSGAKCNISLESDAIAAATYNFTAPSALVVGGRLRVSNATTLQYYATPTSAPVNIVMVAGAADAEYISIAGSLSAQNHKQRVSYGSNKYTESAIRQWLNAGGAAGSYWTSKSNYDLAPSWHSTLAGFRNGLDPDLLAVLGETTREVELNTVTDGGGQATISDNIFLPSRMEIYGSVETAGHKGLQFQAYVGTANVDKIKYDSTALSTARNWWLRSPHAGNSYIPRIAHSVTGELSTISASTGIGAAAACVIL